VPGAPDPPSIPTPTEGNSERRKITVSIAAAAPLAAVLIAAGCGSSASGSAYSAGPYSAATASARSAATATSVGVASSQFGRIVVDGKGRPQYLFEKDKNRRSACYGQCKTTYRPPLLMLAQRLSGKDGVLLLWHPEIDRVRLFVSDVTQLGRVLEGWRLPPTYLSFSRAREYHILHSRAAVNVSGQRLA
jgi:predicted lipoprotein with Yx(FWY)xxD motif